MNSKFSLLESVENFKSFHTHHDLFQAKINSWPYHGGFCEQVLHRKDGIQPFCLLTEDRKNDKTVGGILVLAIHQILNS